MSRLLPLLFVSSLSASTMLGSSADAATRATPSRTARDERFAGAVGAIFGGAYRAHREGDALTLDVDPRAARGRAFPRENTRLLRALLRAESETLGGDEGDDFRLRGYFGDPPAEPSYLEAAQRVGATEIAGESPLVRAWFDDEGHLVRLRVSGEAMRGTSHLPRTPRLGEGAATTCALRGSYAKPAEVVTTLVVASRGGAAYLAWNVRSVAGGGGTFDATVDAATCAVVVHEDKR